VPLVRTTDMEKEPGDLESLVEASGKAMETESSSTPNTKDPAPKEEVPDPDEDDLDDLDGQSGHFLKRY
jgi:peroxin-19